MNKRVAIAAVVLVGAFCLLFTVIAVVGGVLFLRPGGLLEQSGVPDLVPTLNAGLEPTLPARERTPQPDGTATEQPGGTEIDPAPEGRELPAEVQAEMDEIEAQMSNLRGLRAEEPVERDLLTPDELRERVINDFLEDYTPEDMQDDLKVLAAFGLMPEDYDLYNLYVDVYSEQVAGFYDDETRSMYVIQGESFRGPERMTYAHEYTHALQDQNFGMRDGLNIYPEYCEDHSEYCAAVSALVEGDASMSEQQWLFQHSTEEDRGEIMQFYQDYSSPAYDAAPEYLKQDFLFPYQQGLAFVQTLFEAGGWDAVNDAYADPPVTTEQILHPERYPQDAPVAVTLPDLINTLGNDWRELDRNTLGEWYTRLVLLAGWDEDARLSDTQAAQAAEGWGGDQYAVYHNDDAGQTVLALSSRWDNEREAGQFWDAFSRYGERRWGRPSEQTDNALTWNGTPDGYVTVQRNGDATVWVIAPNARTAESVLQAINTP